MTAIAFKYTEGRMVPLGRFRREADATFDEGNIYHLAEVKGRSAASHSHYFACLHDAWLSLPEEMALRFPTEEHLRKWALIRTGHARGVDVACGSVAAAERVAAFMRSDDPYCVSSVAGTSATKWTAISQSNKAMGKEEFQKSKDDVLGFLEVQINVSPGSLMRNQKT